MRFKTPEGFISIFVSGAVVKDKKVLLLHRKDPDVWEFPSGKIEYGEHPSETAKREVKEEANLDVKIERLLSIGSTIRPDKEHEIVICYLCKPLSEDVVLGEPDHSEYKWVTLEEMKKLENLATSVRSVLEELEPLLS